MDPAAPPPPPSPAPSRLLEPAALHERARSVRLLVLDVDGVLTDGGLYYGEGGEVMKRFDVKDGHALVLARHAGLPCALLTARTSRIVEVRARELGLAAVSQGQRDKGQGLRTLVAGLGFSPSECAFMGDDLNDLPALAQVGLATCPSDAVPEVQAAVHWASGRPGGRGAVRELIELCLKARSHWTFPEP